MLLVVGSSGAVGQLMLPHWRLAKAPVVIQYRNGSRPHYSLQALNWNPDDGAGALEDWISAQGHPPRAMLVLAGVTPRSGRDLHLNTQIAETCLAAAQSAGVGRVLVASSSAVYGDHLSRSFSETDHPIPVNAYGEAKLEMERACARFSEALEVVCLRIGNVPGADAVLSRTLQPELPETFLDQFADGGTPERSYIGPGTMADSLVKLGALEQKLPPVLNLAAPAPVQMGALADAAGLSWHGRARSDTKGQSITLDCARLWSFLSAPLNASDPAEMVAQLNFSRSIK